MIHANLAGEVFTKLIYHVDLLLHWWSSELESCVQRKLLGVKKSENPKDRRGNISVFGTVLYCFGYS